MADDRSRKVRAEGNHLRDPAGRLLVLHGVNLMNKGHRGATDPQAFRADWTDHDLQRIVDHGLNCVRLGFIWAAIEPSPGAYDLDYLDWLAGQVDALHKHGLYVILDAHQDLYSQSFGDGAPAWATLTDTAYEPTELWSDAYLSSPAVHQALDAFWSNESGPDGLGLQDHFAAVWKTVAERFADHPAVIGYDLWNEPAPGSAGQEILGSIFQGAVSATDLTMDELMQAWDDPELKAGLLDRLRDPQVHRAVGDAAAPAIARFEREQVGPLMDRLTNVIRTVDAQTMVLREHSYFGNLGIPSGQPPLADANWAYSPHGYDLTVDTEDAGSPSNARAKTIFERSAETAERLGVPVIVGEWGGFGSHQGAAEHGHFLMDLFDEFGWGWTYWCWYPGMTDSWEERMLDRPRPVTVAGDAVTWAVRGDQFTAGWQGRPADAPTVFWLPAEFGTADVRCDGQSVSVERDGGRVLIAAGEGEFRLIAG